MSPPYCPETNIRESGTRFSYISFWAGFRVQKLIYENRVPDYCILVSGRSFLPPFYSSSRGSPPYCPETNIRESGTRFSYISFWAGFRVQKLIYENRVPDYCILVSGRSFLPPFYSSSRGGFGEASGRLWGYFCPSIVSAY